MMALKRNVMIERGCIYCKYYEHWSCRLSHCNMENKIAADPVNKEQHQHSICDQCGYHKPGGCIGYCMQKVLAECKEIWGRDKS